jgi:hypothetical protein
LTSEAVMSSTCSISCLKHAPDPQPHNRIGRDGVFRSSERWVDRIEELEAFLHRRESSNCSLQSIGRSLRAVERSVGFPLINRCLYRTTRSARSCVFGAR